MKYDPSDQVRVQKELEDALIDVQQVIQEYGLPVSLYLRTSSNVTTDRYNSVSKKSSANDTCIETKVWPINDSPHRKFMHSAGNVEEIEKTITFAYKDFLDANFTFDQIDALTASVDIDGVSWSVETKEVGSRHSGQPLEVILGLVKNR